MRNDVTTENVKGKFKKSTLIFTTLLSAMFFLVNLSTVFAANVSLQWDAVAVSGVTGYKIYYSSDSPEAPLNGSGAYEGASPVDVHNQTTATLTGLDSSKSYYFAVTAYDAAGNESDYSNIASILDSSPPSVAISSPASGASVLGTVSVVAAANDNAGVNKVEFLVNGTLQATATAAPYLFSWNTASLAPGNYTLSAKAYDAATNAATSTGVAVRVSSTPVDTAAPIAAITAPAGNASVSGTALVAAAASDNVGVTRVDFYLNGTLRASVNAAPYSFSWDTTTEANGSATLSAKAYDAAGNVGSSSNVLVNVNNLIPDTTSPAVSTFSLPATATATTVAITAFTATDNTSVTGYLVTESASAPAVGAAGWTATAPTSFTFSAAGAKTAYAWARDAAGNISGGMSSAVTITLPNAPQPVVYAFTMPATSTSLRVPVTVFSASNYTGKMITESPAAPAATATGWKGYSPTTFTFTSAGTKTAYAWAKNASGDVSLSMSQTVVITLPDSVAPVVSTFTMPAAATGLTVAISSFSATDNIGVTGYLVSENATAPAASAAGWTVSAPTSVTFSAVGSKTVYAWAKDAAGNVSTSKSANVIIALPNIVANAAANGAISPAGGTSVNYGASQSYTITPNAGFIVTNLVVDGTLLPGATTYTFNNVTTSHYINAYFGPAPANRTIRAAAAPNGVITRAGATSVAEGSSQTYTIIPNAGFVVTNLVVDGLLLPGATAYTFANVTTDHYINAYFGPAPATVTITAAAAANGSISPSGATKVAAGSSQTYSITPKPGFRVTNLVVDGVLLPGATSYTFTSVTSDRYINAYFGP